MVNLDRTDVAAISVLMEALKTLDGSNVELRSATFDIYGEHRIRVTKRRGWGTPHKITSIERLP